LVVTLRAYLWVHAVKSSILDRDAVRRVVSLLVEAEEAVDAASPAATSARSALRVVDSFVVPRFHYDPIKKVFYEYVDTATSF
jgi:DNA polymerase epsilon subunit 2